MYIHHVHWLRFSWSPFTFRLQLFWVVCSHFIISDFSQSILFFMSINNIFWDGTGVWTQYLMLAKQVSCHFSHSPSHMKNIFNGVFLKRALYDTLGYPFKLLVSILQVWNWVYSEHNRIYQWKLLRQDK
jgi:hypothetical protein